jgi:Zn-dependent alcohol dehydrogenase
MPKLRVKPLVTARFPLEKIEDAFAHATAGRGVKTIVTPGAA